MRRTSRRTMDRREFIRRGSMVAAVGVMMPQTARAFQTFESFYNDRLRSIDPRDRDAIFSVSRTLATAAIDAARSAGAHYADVRLTHDLTLGVSWLFPTTYTQVSAVGVRVLVDGCWGFAASPVWTTDEVTRLAREAVEQARRNRIATEGEVRLIDTIPPARGDWSMPIEQDPFTLPENEMVDWLQSIALSAVHLPKRGAPRITVLADARRQQKTFASSDEALCTQTTYALLEAPSALEITLTHPDTGQEIRHRSSAITPTGAGWEAIRNIDVKAVLEQLYEEAWLIVQGTPVTIGRYDIVCDALTTASLVHETLGVPLQIDRALGYEANAAGTSYLDYTDHSVSLSSPLLHVRGHRNQPQGMATVRWDDEGVEPSAIELINGGKVVDYATSREHVSVRHDQSIAHSLPVRSSGCAGSENALGFTLVQSPNLELVPLPNGATFDQLVATTAKGYAVYNGIAIMDQQQLTGLVRPGFVREIKDGKLGKVMRGASVLFRSTELWKNLSNLGSPGTQMWRGVPMTKGQPRQTLASSVLAVPASFRDISVIDASRQSRGGR